MLHQVAAMISQNEESVDTIAIKPCAFAFLADMTI